MRDKVRLPQGLVVEVINGDIERALRRLKKKMQNDGVFQEMRDREAFMKPSEKRRRDRAASISREKKRVRMEQSQDETKYDSRD